VIAGDFDGDGLLDLVTANEGSDTLTVLSGDGTGAFRTTATVPAGGRGPWSLAVGDFDRDGTLDLAVALWGYIDCPSGCVQYVAGTTISVLLGRGDGTFGPPRPFTVGRGADSVIAADFDDDGILDLAVANGASGTVSVLVGRGDGTFNPAQHFGAGLGAMGMATGDFNGGGKLDLAVANEFSNSVSILINGTVKR